MRRLLLLALTLLLGGCMVGPDYVRPKVDAPAAFRYEDREARETADTAWWRQFQDPVLDGLIAEALANNRSVKAAAANVEKAAGVLVQTRSPLWPQLSYSGSAARERASESGTVKVPGGVENPYSAYQALASVSWEIDLWGRVRRLSEAARADLLATEEAGHGVILSLTASVATSYIQLLSLDEQLRVARRTLGTYSESVQLFELRYRYGQVSLMNVEQARSQYETAATAIPPLESQIAQTENALSILLGRNPGPIRRGRTIQQLALPAVPAGLPAEVLARRPDIRQAEQNLIAANAQIGAARALYFPTISLTGAFGYSSADLANLFAGPARLWNYTGSITGPIFKGGGIAGQVQQAEAAQKAALYNYELTIQNAFADTENALVSHSKLVEQLQAQERLVRANREYARLARLQFEGGYAPYSTVLQAEQQLFPSELSEIKYRGDLCTTLVNIYKALGGGWEVAAGVLSGSPPIPAE